MWERLQLRQTVSSTLANLDFWLIFWPVIMVVAILNAAFIGSAIVTIGLVVFEVMAIITNVIENKAARR